MLLGKKIALVLFLTIEFQSLSLAKPIEILGSDLSYYPNSQVEYSRMGEEDSISIEADQAIIFTFQDWFTLRGKTEKISFTPLSKSALNDDEKRKNVFGIIGFQLPNHIANMSMLFQRLYLENGVSQRQCQVLIFYSVTDSVSKEDLLNSLFEMDIEPLELQQDYWSVDCQNNSKVNP